MSIQQSPEILLENKGIKTNTFYIPPFDLKTGEIVVLNLLNGAHFYETEMFLKAIFIGETAHNAVTTHRKLTFVEHFIEPRFRRLFSPVTVGEYLKKNADLSSSFASKIYENKWITLKTKVNALAGTPRKLLSLYATLSKTNQLVFDLVALDPSGVEMAYNVVKEVASHGGSAILLDGFGDIKDNRAKFIALEWINDTALKNTHESK